MKIYMSWETTLWKIKVLIYYYCLINFVPPMVATVNSIIGHFVTHFYRETSSIIGKNMTIFWFNQKQYDHQQSNYGIYYYKIICFLFKILF